MSKPLLDKTKDEFVRWFAQQNDDMRYLLATTPYEAKTQVARFRRLYIKTLNSMNRKKLK